MEVIRMDLGPMKKQSFLSVYKHLKAVSGTDRDRAQIWCYCISSETN